MGGRMETQLTSYIPIQILKKIVNTYCGKYYFLLNYNFLRFWFLHILSQVQSKILCIAGVGRSRSYTVVIKIESRMPGQGILIQPRQRHRSLPALKSVLCRHHCLQIGHDGKPSVYNNSKSKLYSAQQYKYQIHFETLKKAQTPNK